MEIPEIVELGPFGEATNLPPNLDRIPTEYRPYIKEYCSFLYEGRLVCYGFVLDEGNTLREIEMKEDCLALVRSENHSLVLCEDNIYICSVDRDSKYKVVLLEPRKPVRYLFAPPYVAYIYEDKVHIVSEDNSFTLSCSGLDTLFPEYRAVAKDPSFINGAATKIMSNAKPIIAFMRDGLVLFGVHPDKREFVDLRNFARFVKPQEYSEYSIRLKLKPRLPFPQIMLDYNKKKSARK